MDDPVEIDILVRQNVSEEGEKATRSLKDMSDASDDVKTAASDALALQQAAIQKLRAEIEPLKKQLAELASNMPQLDKAKIENLGKGVDELESRLIKATGSLEKMDMDAEGLNVQIKNLEERIRALALEILNLNKSGEAESETLKEKTAALEYYMNARNELLNSLKNLSGDGDLTEIIEQLKQLQAEAGESGNGIDTLSESSDAYSGILQRLASMLALAGSQLGINTGLLNQSSQIVGRLLKQKGLLVNVTNALSRALGISAAAAKGLTLVMGGVLTAGIGAAIYFVGKYVEKWREAREQEKKHAESVADNAAKQIANYEKLRRSYNQLGKDVKEKEKFIRENKDAFKQLGIAINGVNDADSVFINNTDAFREAIMQRAIAAASMELATEEYKKMLLERQKRKKKEEDVKRQTEQRKEALEIANAMRDPNAPLQPDNTNWQMTVKPTITKVPYAKTKKEVVEAMTDAEADAKRAAEEWIKQSVDADKSADDIYKKLGIKKWAPTTKTPKEKSSTKEENERKRALEKLRKFTLDIQDETEATIVASMRDGAEKKLAELKNDFDRRKALITERLYEIEQMEINTGVDGSKQKEQLAGLLDAEQAKYEADVIAAKQAAKAVQDEMWDEINSRFRTESENRLADISRFYNEQIKRAKELGATQAELDRIELARKKDLAIEKNMLSLKEFDFREQIELKRAELENQTYGLQADREEKLLNMQLLSAQKRLQRLIRLKELGADVDKDIEEARYEIERLGVDLERIPVNKLAEIAGHIKSMMQSLSGIGGEFGETMGALADGIDDIVGVFSKENTTLDNISGAVSGLSKLYGMVANQIAENKKKQEEWNEVIAETEHRARMIRIAQSDYEQSNLFGVENPYAKAIAGAKQYSDSMKELHDMTNKLEAGRVQTGTKKVLSGKNIATGAGAGAVAGGSIGSLILPGLGTLIGAGIGALVGGVVGATQTKIVPVFESLTKRFGTILKKGTKTFELNPAILENYANLDEATKELVDNWEEIRQKALEAEKQMEETFRDLAGDIGQQLSNSLADAFRSGDVFSAVDDFQEKVTGTIEKIIEQMIFAAIFQSQLEELQERMKNSFKEGGDETIVDDIIWFSKIYKSGLETYNKNMAEAKTELERQGFNPWTNDGEAGRQAVARGIAQASQDSIDELNGRITFLVMKVNDISAVSVLQAEFNREQLVVQHAMLGHLEVIAENSEFLKKLEGISDDINRMVREGVHIK